MIRNSANRSNERYDYFASSQTFALRIPTTVHATFAAAVAQDISNQLRALADDEDPELATAAAFARDVVSGGSSELRLVNLAQPSNDGPVKDELHQPDGNLKHIRSEYPGVVIEVSHSQPSKTLGVLADAYILGSEGDIGMMLGLDLQYPGRVFKRATLTVYTPELRQVVEQNEDTTATITEMRVKKIIDKQVRSFIFLASSTQPTHSLIRVPGVPYRRWPPPLLSCNIYPGHSLDHFLGLRPCKPTSLDLHHHPFRAPA